jgi:hypothetical protein
MLYNVENATVIAIEALSMRYDMTVTQYIVDSKPTPPTQGGTMPPSK